MGRGEPDAVADEIGSELIAHDVALVPELLSFRRKVLIREAIESPALEELVPILPATRFLLEMRRAGGYVIGRRHVASRAGLVDLSRAERARATEGLALLAETIRLLDSGGACVWPGSGAPDFGVTPGIGLLEEIALLVETGVPLERMLVAATSGAADRLAVDGRTGRLRSGDPARLATSRAPAEVGALATIASIRGFSG